MMMVESTETKYFGLLIVCLVVLIISLSLLWIKVRVPTPPNNFEDIKSKLVSAFPYSVIGINPDVKVEKVGDLYHVYVGFYDKVLRKDVKLYDFIVVPSSNKIFLGTGKFGNISMYALIEYTYLIDFLGKVKESLSKYLYKADRIQMKIFVMSFCPYGASLLKTLAYLYKYLGGYYDIQVYYILTNTSRNCLKVGKYCLSSMHGLEEVKEDLRQLYILHEIGKGAYWNYLYKFYVEKDCFRNRGDCWKKAAEEAGINVNVLGGIFTDPMKIKKLEEILDKNFEEMNKYKAFASPTVIVNSNKIVGLRDFLGGSYYITLRYLCTVLNNSPSICKKY